MNAEIGINEYVVTVNGCRGKLLSNVHMTLCHLTQTNRQRLQLAICSLSM